jgi:hypothetical protein
MELPMLQKYNKIKNDVINHFKKLNKDFLNLLDKLLKKENKQQLFIKKGYQKRLKEMEPVLHEAIPTVVDEAGIFKLPASSIVKASTKNNIYAKNGRDVTFSTGQTPGQAISN